MFTLMCSHGHPAMLALSREIRLRPHPFLGGHHSLPTKLHKKKVAVFAQIRERLRELLLVPCMFLALEPYSHVS